MQSFHNDLNSYITLNNVSQVKAVLSLGLPLSLNQGQLISACTKGHGEIVSLLLAHPEVDPNKPDLQGWTAFAWCFHYGKEDATIRMLADPRVDVNQLDLHSRTPLWWAARDGQTKVIKLLLANSRTIDVTTRGGSGNRSTAAENARTGDHLALADLLDAYQRDPVMVRQQLRRELGMEETLAAEVFAVLVLLSDGFLAHRENTRFTEAERLARRFLVIGEQLPLELQMVLCNRMFGLASSIQLSMNTEPAFRLVVRETAIVEARSSEKTRLLDFYSSNMPSLPNWFGEGETPQDRGGDKEDAKPEQKPQQPSRSGAGCLVM